MLKYFSIWKGIKEGKEDFHAAGMSRCSSVWPADYSGLIKSCLLPAHGAAVAIRRIFTKEGADLYDLLSRTH